MQRIINPRTFPRGIKPRGKAIIYPHPRGKPRGFREGEGIKLDLSCGTPFQRKVWRQLTKIPHGEVRSYAWVAKKIGCPKGARAVGQAVKKNPFPIVVPCHRVIASDGSIGGFSLGVKKKRELLAREGVILKTRD